MEKTTIALAVVAVVMLATAGLAFAAPGAGFWQQGNTGAAGKYLHVGDANNTNLSHAGARHMRNANWTNSTAFNRPRMGAWNGADGTAFAGFGPRHNGTNGSAIGPEPRNFEFANGTNVSALISRFDSAVLSGDYSTAKQLNTEYGFGGPMFAALNESTFPKYSRISNLEKELRAELGMDSANAGFPAQRPGFGQGFGPKPMGRGMMGSRASMRRN